jgi:hypothetical protein
LRRVDCVYDQISFNRQESCCCEEEREIRNSEGQQRSFLSEAVAWIEFCRAAPATCANAVGWFLLAWDSRPERTT